MILHPKVANSTGGLAERNNYAMPDTPFLGKRKKGLNLEKANSLDTMDFQTCYEYGTVWNSAYHKASF